MEHPYLKMFGNITALGVLLGGLTVLTSFGLGFGAPHEAICKERYVEGDVILLEDAEFIRIGELRELVEQQTDGCVSVVASDGGTGPFSFYTPAGKAAIGSDRTITVEVFGLP